MGNACCVAARDKMVIPNSSSSSLLGGGENLKSRRRRSNNNNNNLRQSPNWSFRWDTNRGRVAGEETTSLSWLSSDGISHNNNNDGSEFKFESAFVSNASSEGSPSLDSFRTRMLLQKSPAASDLSFPRNSSMDTVFEQKENVSPAQLPFSLPSQPSSFATSPLSSQSYLNPSSSSMTLKPTQRPRLSSNQLSDSQINEVNSATDSENLSLQAFSEMMSSSPPLLSYDNDSFGLLQRDKNRTTSSSSSCGACSRPLSEKSLWNNSSQRIFTASNELSVSAILACGHVYHGECLEQMTPEIDKFDPSCPICTFGEKNTMKLSEKALELKARQNKRLRRNRVLDNEFDCDDDDFVMFDDHSHHHNHHGTGGARAGKSPKLVSAKSYSPKPFLAKHFSFGSRSNCEESHQPVKKKGFFWTKSSKI